MKSLLLAGVLSIGASILPAAATTVNFSYFSDASPVAVGSFSYADGATGVLGYGDLTSFTLTIDSVTVFNLVDVLAMTDYLWFAYDTATNGFVPSEGSCGFIGCAFYPTLSASNGEGTEGFFFSTVALGIYQNFTTGEFGSFGSMALMPVPEPGSLALLGAGLLGLGAIRRRAAARAG